MIVFREDCVLGILPFEHAGSMSDANVEATVGCVFFGGFDHWSTGVLLQNIPDHLNGTYVRLTLAKLNGFVQPADGRAKSGAPDSDLPFFLELAERLPNFGITYMLHFDVM